MKNNVIALKQAYPPVAPVERAPQVSIHDLFIAPPAPQRFLIEDILPGGVVTLLGAHGGAGKSTLALIAAVCLVAGRTFMGKATEKCRVVFFSGEDPAPVIRRRLARICRHMNISPHELNADLLMLDATESPTLYNGRETDALAALRLDVKEFKPGAVIIDNASDVYDASEIERARVREFIRLVEMTLPDKPTSRNQRYRLTAIGQRWLDTHPGGSAG